MKQYYAIEEWKLQSGFDSDCSLTIMKGSTLSTPPSIGWRGIKFLNSPNYIWWSKKAFEAIQGEWSKTVVNALSCQMEQVGWSKTNVNVLPRQWMKKFEARP